MKVVLMCVFTLAVLAGLATMQSTASYTPSGNYYFFGTFNDDSWKNTWVSSGNSRYTGRATVSEPEELNGAPGHKMLTLPDAARHYGIAAPFDKTFNTEGKTIVVQYEVRLSKGLECGGAYLKLVSAEPEQPGLEELNNDTPYTIMFGPDKCGFDTNKVHFIFRHRNPVSGVFEEKHMEKAPAVRLDKISHLYTLVVRPDNSFEVQIDQEVAIKGNLLEDFKPAVNPPREIDDPSDQKPADWVDEEMIADPEATKPEDWDESAPMEIEDADAVKPEGWLDDEPATVADPEAMKPEDWNDEDDGEWEAPRISNPLCEAVGCGVWQRPTIRNPAYKGKWSAPLIKNPKYIGKWAPRQIANPNYFEDKHPHNMTPIGAVAIEVWTMTGDLMFDNILVTDSEDVARDVAEHTFSLRHAREVELLAAATPAKPSETLQGKLQQNVELVTALAQQQPLVAAGVASAIGVLLISLCWCLCCRRSSKAAPTAAPEADAATAAPAAAAAAADAPAASAAPAAVPTDAAAPKAAAKTDAAVSKRKPTRKEE